MKMVFYSLLLLLILLPTAKAGIEMEITPKEATTIPDNLAAFIISLKNNQDFKDMISIVVSGERLEWKIPGPFAIEVPAGEEREIDMMFLPVGEDYGTYAYTVIARSNKAEGINNTAEIRLTVKKPVEIKNISAKQMYADVFVDFVIESFRRRDVSIVIQLLGENDQMIYEQKIAAEVEGIKTVNLKLGEASAGKYKIKASAEGFAEETIDFEVEPYRNVVKTTEISSNWLLSDTVTVYIHNYGNVEEEYIVLEENMRSDVVTGFITKPTECDSSTGRCSFVITDLKPGEIAMVSYKLDYWPFTLLYGFGGLAAIFLGHSVVFRIHRPRILKRCKRKGLSHDVTIEVKNSFTQTLRNVIIRDWVSPLAKIHEEFQTARPILRRSDAGTELIWRLGNMKPHEERVLTYKIRPLIGGYLKMPRAYMRFMNNAGKTDRIYSKKIVIKHRI